MFIRFSILSPLILLCALFASGPAAASAAEREISGSVVDQSGRPVPRAYVRAVDPSGAERAGAFADESGWFALAIDSAGGCRVEAALTGFQPASVPCPAAGAGPMRLLLAVAPIQETLIVSATRTEAPTSQVGAAATVFTADDLQRRQNPLLADLLVGTPGTMLVRSGAPGTVTSLFVRGGESDYNKVLLDGVPLNEPGGLFYLSNLTTENLERVEIVRGAYSSLFGSDAMGSVIQLFTKRADRASSRPSVSAQIDGGTYDTLHVAASASGAAGPLDYSVGAARFGTDNRVTNSGFDNTSLSANLGIALGANATLRVIGRAERGLTGTPGQTAFGRPDLDAFFRRHDSVGSVSFDQRVGRALRQRAAYSVATSLQESTNLVEDPPYVAAFDGRTAVWTSSDFLNDSVARVRRHHAGYQADLRLGTAIANGDHRLTLLADWDGERSRTDDRLTAAQTVDARDNFGVSAQHQMLWPRLFVTLSGRVEHNDSFGTAAVPRATAVYIARAGSGLLGETQLRASLGYGIKEPTLLESFSLSPYFRGNPALQPERSRSAEIGLEQRIGNDRAKIDVTYFDNRFSDVITLVTTNPATFEGRYENVGLTRARGLEAALQARPTAAVHLRGGYTLLDSKILRSERPDDVLFGLGKQLFRRPRHSGFMGATLTWKRVTADLDGVFVGAFVDSDFGLFDPPLAENPGYRTWDARATVQLTPQVAALLSADNLTDRDYSAPFGYQPLRRMIRAGLRVEF